MVDILSSDLAKELVTMNDVIKAIVEAYKKSINDYKNCV
jgi:hypothetical protein